MTREEAIRKAINIVAYFEAHFAKSKEAREDAVNIIEALEQEPCDDAISRRVVLDLVVANHTELNGLNVVMYAPFYKDITQLPPVTPQQRTGQWIRVTDKTGHFVWECNKCHWQQRFNTNFCPDCGARMDVEE